MLQNLMKTKSIDPWTNKDQGTSWSKCQNAGVRKILKADKGHIHVHMHTTQKEAK